MHPKTVGPFIWGSTLSSASMGEIVRGLPLEGEPVIRLIQILREPLSSNGEAKSLLKRTAKQWASMRDLHAIGLLGSGESEGLTYLVYEYQQGRLLSDILDRCHQEGLPLSGDQAVYLCERLAGALLSVSSSGTAFGCLSPERVLVTFEGEVKLLPGVFRDLHTTPVSGEPELLNYRRCLPPSLPSDRATRPSADRYALGALMFELLCREPFRTADGPFDPSARLDGIRSGPGGSDLLPEPLYAILKKSCVPETPGAYADLAAMKADLDQLISSGEFSPTTFNIAFLMHTLFRGEDETDVAADQAFLSMDRLPFKPAPPPPSPPAVGSPGAPAPVGAPPQVPTAEALPSFGLEPEPSRKGLFIGVGAAAVVVLVAVLGYFAFFQTKGPSPAETSAQEQLAKLQIEQQAMTAKLKSLEDEKAQLAAQVENAKTADEKQRAQKALEDAQTRLLAQKEEQKKLASTVPATITPAAKEPSAPVEQAKIAPVTPASAAISPAPADIPPPAPSPEQSAAPPGPVESKVKAGDFVELWGVDVKPKQISELRVDMPSAARQNRASGTIYVEVAIDETGRVTGAKVVKGLPSDFGLNRACEDAAMKLKYSPAISGGVPVKTKMTFPILVR
jgi:TonB family protein